MSMRQGVSSIKPDNSDEMDGAKEFVGSFVVAGGDAAMLLRLTRELLSQVERPIEVFVAVA